MNPLLEKVVRNKHQRQKWQQLESLASQVEKGVIVELGTYLGYGAIALCSRSKVPVYTVDDYQNRQGWAGEVYYPKDEEIFWRNIKEADLSMLPKLSKSDARWIGHNWKRIDFTPYLYWDIELLVWDLGIPARLCEDFEAWEPHITGKFVIHDTDDNRLGSDLLNPAGWSKQKEGVFWVLERT